MMFRSKVTLATLVALFFSGTGWLAAQTGPLKSDQMAAEGRTANRTPTLVRNHTGEAPIYDQGDFTNGNSHEISTFVAALDVHFDRTVRFDGLKVWIADGPGGDNGMLDFFSGTLSWALLEDSAGTPGAVIFSGEATDLTGTDTGLQDLFDDDIFEFEIETGLIDIDPGSYWFALREGSWGSPWDGTQIYWVMAETTRGLGALANGDEEELMDDWLEPGRGPMDPGLVLFGDALDVSQTSDDGGSDPSETLAQTFEANTDSVSGASLLTVGSRAASVSVELWDGLPNAGGTLLADGELADFEPGGWAELSWPPVPVTTHTSYVLIISLTGDDVAIASNSMNPYAGGQAHVGADFIPVLDTDFTFRTWAETPASLWDDGFESGDTSRWSLTVPEPAAE